MFANGEKKNSCVHCKTCDIKVPDQDINWATPQVRYPLRTREPHSVARADAGAGRRGAKVRLDVKRSVAFLCGISCFDSVIVYMLGRGKRQVHIITKAATAAWPVGYGGVEYVPCI